MFVNLVGEAERVKLLTERGDEFHLFPRKNFAGGIVGIANDDRPGFVVEGGTQLVSVETPVGRA